MNTRSQTDVAPRYSHAHQPKNDERCSARPADLGSDPAEKNRREESDFLAHKNHAGLYADFHSLRHYFITSLERAGLSPKMAQTLARHSDIRLTLGVYTHVGLHDQTAAIGTLPGPLCDSKGRTDDMKNARGSSRVG